MTSFKMFSYENILGERKTASWSNGHFGETIVGHSRQVETTKIETEIETGFKLGQIITRATGRITFGMKFTKLYCYRDEIHQALLLQICLLL